jgi:hypothetical protein
MSFLGYGNIYPNSNVNPHYVNVGNTNDPAMFTSTQIPGQNGLPGLYGTKSNVAAAAGIYTKSMKGGKRRRASNKNLRSMYKKTMAKSRTHRYRKGKKMSRGGRRRRSMTHKSRGKMYGGLPSNGGVPANYGYGFSQGPYSVSYGLGGNLPPSLSALAQPMYYKINYTK